MTMPLIQGEIDPALSASPEAIAVRFELATRFPQIRMADRGRTNPTAELDTERWADPDVDLLSFDRVVHAAEQAARETRGMVRLRLKGQRPRVWLTGARQMLRRYQRLFARRNAFSASNLFDHVLARHADLHDISKPLVRADYDHALDVWQWVLTLEPSAGLSVQVAALFHDVERLATEADARVEQHAPDYQSFKEAHAARGADLLVGSLSDVGLDERMLMRAAQLVLGHERPDGDPEVALLNDADALSFFALNAAGFVAYFGPEHTEKKVRYTLARMRPKARAILRELRLPAGISAQINAAGQAA